ncbi:hypothetical protein ACHAWF_016290 [Thalassiosira exigua]
MAPSASVPPGGVAAPPSSDSDGADSVPAPPPKRPAEAEPKEMRAAGGEARSRAGGAIGVAPPPFAPPFDDGGWTGDGASDDGTVDESDDDDDLDVTRGDEIRRPGSAEEPARTRDDAFLEAFRDPFPILSPVPPPAAKPPGAGRFAPRFAAFEGGDAASITPPRAPFPPSGARSPRTPADQRTGSRGSGGLGGSGFGSFAARPERQRSWVDPFPTPDASVLSRAGTPCSLRAKADDDDEEDKADDDDGRPKVILNADWDALFRSVPKVPPAEELDDLPVLGDEGEGGAGRGDSCHRNNNNDDDQKTEAGDGRAGREGRGRSESLSQRPCPRIPSSGLLAPECADEKGVEEGEGRGEPRVKKSSSTSDLPLMRRPSWDDLWAAFSSGPDGNDLHVDEGGRKGQRRLGEGRSRRRGANAGGNEGWALDPRGGEGRNAVLRRRRGRRKTSERSSGRWQTLERGATNPADASWRDLITPLAPPPGPSPDGENRGSVGECDNSSRRTECNNPLRHNSSTITNVTGAGLAQEVRKIMVRRERADGTPGAPLSPARVRSLASATELVFSPVHRVRAAARDARRRIREGRDARRRRRLARAAEARPPPRSWWIVVPADHPLKVAWDVMTMVWALLGAYRTHVRIRDRVFDQSPLILLTEIWFTIDILLNFVTEHKTSRGEVLRDGKAVWARYLTTWFVVDILSLVPWERIYVRPVVERIKRRNILQKTFFRSKAVVRVSRVLRGRHIRLFGKVSRQTGTPLRRMVATAVRYVPRYLVFLKNMKGALAVRSLRLVHWLWGIYKKFWVKAKDARRRYVAQRNSRRVARRAYLARRYSFAPGAGGARRRGVFDRFLLGRRAPSGNESDDDSSEDDDDDDDDDEEADESELDGDYESDYSAPVTPLYRAHSEGSPPRRRSFSQNEVYATLR